MGISSAISIAVAGLQLNQQESALAAANIAGASQAGYTRKVLTTSSTNAGNQAIIDLTSEVHRQLDLEVQRQLVTSTSESSYLSTQQSYATSLDALFGTPGSSNTLESTISALSSALSNLQTSPTDQSVQLAAVSAAQTLAQQLNQLSSSIQSQRSQAEGAISDGVTQVNSLTSQIADLNAKIISGQAAGQDVTNLEDQRDLGVTQLAGYVDVVTRTQPNGDMSIFTTGGLQLVDGKANQLTFNKAGALTAFSSWAPGSASTVGTITIGSGANQTDVIATGLIRSGSLAALINQRDTVLVQAQNQLDDLAASISSAFSDTTTSGTAASSGTQTGLAVDVTGLQSGNPVELTYKDNTTGTTKKVMFVAVTAQTPLPLPQSLSNDPAEKVVGVNFSAGMSSAAATIQAALGSNFTVSNPSGNSLQILDDGTATNKVDVTGLTARVTATSVQGGSTAVPLFTVGGTGLPYTGAYNGQLQKTGLSSLITVNPLIVGDPSLLVKYSSSTQDGDPARPAALVDRLSNAQFTFGPETGIVAGTNSFTASISDFANQITAHWGQVSADATSAQSSQAVIQNNLQQRYTASSAVSMDQELAQLVQIQAAYSANARVLSIAQSMLSTLMQIQV